MRHNTLHIMKNINILNSEELSSIENSIQQVPPFQDRFMVWGKDAYEVVLYKDILWIKASRNFCELYVDHRQKILVSHPLLFMEKILQGELFMRVHRSYFINLQQVTRLRGNMIYIDKQDIPLGQPYREEFLDHFLVAGSVKGLHK